MKMHSTYEHAIEKIIGFLNSRKNNGKTIDPLYSNLLIHEFATNIEGKNEEKRRKEREGRAVDAIRENLMSRISRKERFSIGDTINNLVYDFYPLKEGGYSCLIYDRKQKDEDGLIPRIGDTTTDDPLSLLSERNVSLSDISIQDLEPEEEESEAPYQEQLIGEVKNLLNQGSYFSIRQESGDVIQVFPRAQADNKYIWHVKSGHNILTYRTPEEIIQALNIRANDLIEDTTPPYKSALEALVADQNIVEIRVYSIFPNDKRKCSLVRNKDGTWTYFDGSNEWSIRDINMYINQDSVALNFSGGVWGVTKNDFANRVNGVTYRWVERVKRRL